MNKMKTLNSGVVTKIANNLESSLRELRRCGAHRSSRATLIEMGIQLRGFKSDLTETNKFNAMLANARIENTVPYQLPAAEMTVKVERQVTPELTTIVLNNHHSDQPVIVYLTGGAYLQRPDKTHWDYLNRLAEKSGAKIYVPIYSLVPNATFRRAYLQLASLYGKLYGLVPASQITVMGDSAGGGLALGFCQYLAQRNLPQPGHLILFSPWLDLDLTNPVIAKYEHKDVTLAVTGLKKIGKLWAGDTNHRDYRLSPLFGYFSQLRNVMIVAGTREIMYPDATILAQKLKAAQIPVQLVVGRGMFHIYPLYQLPEARQLMEQVVAVINQ